MRSTVFEIEVNLPEVADFAAAYPPYGTWANEKGSFLFSLLMMPENFLRARFATEMGLPAVAGVAAVCDAAAAKKGFDLKDDKFAKQAIGAMICVLMEANGYEKTGERKAIPHSSFTKGTVYRASTRHQKTP